MAKLSAAQRDALPDSAFAGPNRTFPIHDKNHAREALAMAQKSYNAGNISRAERDKIIARAKRKLGQDD